MSVQKIQSALEKHLATMAGNLPTAFENEPFTPPTGQPYQRIYLLVNTPVDHAVTMDVTEQRGLFQVSLYFPEGAGRGAAQAYAEALAQHFKPVQTLANGALKVELASTVQVGSGSQDDGCWSIPVKVRWRSFS